MATRTIKLMGKAYAASGNVSLVVNFNNSEVFNGEVTTTAGASPVKGQTGVELASWTVDTSVSGNIPLSIAVSGGVFHFQTLQGNYVGWEPQGTEPDNASDHSWADTNADGTEYIVTTQPVNYYGEMNTNSSSSDGKNNVSFSSSDGDTVTRSVVEADETTGEWIYVIQDGVTFSCDFVIDSNLTVETVPAP